MDEMQGVMALPEAQGAGMRPEDMAIFEQIRQTIPRQEITKEFLAAGEQADPQAVAEFKQELAGLELTPDELNKLNTMVDAILAAPQDYASLRRAYLAEGMPEDLLPEQFDPAFFAALNMAIDTIAMNPGSPPPMAMAMGGVADLAAYGRNGDTMLAHITPQEAAMLKRMGGSGTINPYTGLPEYASIFKKIGNAVKKFAKSTVGKVIIGVGASLFLGPLAASFLGPTLGAAATGFAASAGTTLLSGGNLRDALKAGVFGGLSAGLFQGVTQSFQGLPTGAETAAAGAPSVSPTGAAPTGVGTAADIVGTPEMQIGQYSAPVPDRIPGVSPFGSQVSQQTIPAVDNPFGIDVRPTPPAPLADPRFGGNFVSQADRFGAEIPLDTGNLTPNELTGEVAKNTGSGTYSPQGKFTPASAGRGPILDAAYPELSVKTGATSGGGGVMDLIRQGEYGKAAGAAYDRFMPEALGGQRGAVTPEMINDMRSKATDLVMAKHPSFAAQAMTDPTAKTIFDKMVTDQATKLATPSMLSTYGPLAALGVGALGLAGGFKTKDATPPDMAMFRGPSPQQLAAARLYYGGIRPTAYGGMYLTPPGYAEGGGVMDTPQAMRVGGKTYPRKIGAINGPGTGTSDSIPAMLSDGEFVFTAKAVRAMGNGSRRKGAKKMYKLMKMLEGKAA